MATEEIVKVTSKGQFTIPAEIRRELRLDDGSYMYVKAVGKIIVMSKVDDIDLREISTILGRSRRIRDGLGQSCIKRQRRHGGS